MRRVRSKMFASGRGLASSAALMSEATGTTLALAEALADGVVLAEGNGERSVTVCAGTHAPTTTMHAIRRASGRGMFTTGGTRRRAFASRRRAHRGDSDAAP